MERGNSLDTKRNIDYLERVETFQVVTKDGVFVSVMNITNNIYCLVLGLFGFTLLVNLYLSYVTDFASQTVVDYYDLMNHQIGLYREQHLIPILET